MDFSKYHFVYNAAAHFAATDRYADGLVAEMGKNGSAGFSALCWALAELSMQGELVRRDMGYDKGDTLDESKLQLHLKLRDIPVARQLITDALIAGVGSGDAEGEVDEVMLELQKKTKGK